MSFEQEQLEVDDGLNCWKGGPRPRIIPRPASTCSLASGNTFEKLFLQMTDLARCHLDQIGSIPRL